MSLPIYKKIFMLLLGTLKPHSNGHLDGLRNRPLSHSQSPQVQVTIPTRTIPTSTIPTLTIPTRTVPTEA